MDRVRQLRSLKEEVLGAVRRLSRDQMLSTSTVKEHFTALHPLVTLSPHNEEVTYGIPVKNADTEALSEKMHELAVAMENLSLEGKTIALEQMMLQRLHFQGIKDRHDNVKNAHTNTFMWIFEDDTEEERRCHEYVDWLQNGDGIFWISGKPGSGKSTLLKFLYHHEATVKHLQAWAGSKKLITANFFFWNAGAKLQMSQEGLLRSLLFEIFRQAPDLIPQAYNQKAMLGPYPRDPDPWTRDELWDCFWRLSEGATESVRFCIFINGLDEYHLSEDGSFRELAQLLLRMSGCADIKLCLASRPENDFIDAFGRSRQNFLRLEDLMKPDIHQYVGDCFLNSNRFQQHQLQNPKYNRLVQRIVDEAKGVFLWVFLAVNSIPQGFSNADRIEDLEKRLTRVPKTLEDYFQNILESVDDEYQEQTARQILIALESTEPLDLSTLWFLEGENLDFGPQHRRRPLPLNSEHIEYIVDTMRRRLQARCKGLLEFSIVSDREATRPLDSTSLFSLKMDFLHRTVRDYLLQPQMQKVFRNNLPADFEPMILLCQAFLQRFKAIPQLDIEPNSEISADILEDLLVCSFQVERDSEVLLAALRQILSEAEETIVLQAKYRGKPGKYLRNLFLGRVIKNGLRLYLSHKLSMDGSVVHDKETLLLAHALDISPNFPTAGYALLKLLFTHGADLNEKMSTELGQHGRMTIWHNLLLNLYLRPHAYAHHPRLYDVLHLLIANGADLDQQVHVDTKYIAPRRATGRASDLYHREKEDRIYTKAKDIIQGTISADQATRLFGKASKKERSKSIAKLVPGVWKR